jgi:CNT family concentrative nucleoside transporter
MSSPFGEDSNQFPTGRLWALTALLRTTLMSIYNLVSFLGIFGLCAIAWAFSENRKPQYIPWRVIIWGIGLQLALGFLIFLFPPTRTALEWFTGLLDGVFTAADTGARFVFGRNIVPVPGQDPPINLGYIFAFRALPTVVFFSGLMALLYNIGVIQIITEVFAKLFYNTMRLSGAEALSGAANIFVGIEAAIVVKPYLPQMTRSELCAILSCCFGTAASSTLAIYVSFLKPVFPNILGHLVSASIIAIPACFVISKILVPETGTPLTMGGIPKEEKKSKGREFIGEEISDEDSEYTPQETVGGEPIERVSPLDAAIVGALDGVKMAVAIAAVLILILGLVSLVNQTFGALASLETSQNTLLQPIGQVFSVITLQNIQGVLFYPLTLLTGVPFADSWEASVIIGRRLLETAIPPYQSLAEAAAKGEITPRTVLIVSYALSGFAHLASVGIFVGGTIALIPSRRKDISELGWKALFVGTLATMMIACIAGVFDTGDASILGENTAPAVAPLTAPATPKSTVSPSPAASSAPAIASPSPAASPKPPAGQASPKSSPKPAISPSPKASSSPK